MEEIELGHKVRDIVSGFTGIAIIRIEHLDGRVEFGVRGLATPRDDKLPPVQQIPAALLRKVDGGIVVAPVPPRQVGFNPTVSHWWVALALHVCAWCYFVYRPHKNAI